MKIKGYELWDPETSNLVASFASKREALKALSAALRESPEWARELQLFAIDAMSGEPVLIEVHEPHVSAAVR